MADPQTVAVDKSLVAAKGPLWHKRVIGKRDVYPRGFTEWIRKALGVIRIMTAGSKATVFK